MTLRIEALRAGYGDRMILDGLDLTIAAGDRISLIGHNGAGKSTILKAITGQIRPRAGSISFEGAPTTRLSPEALVARGIVQVPAGRRVFPGLTIEQNLRMGAYTRKDRAGVAADIAAHYDRFPVLGRKRAHLAGTMSGGEQQMLAIARALMARPKLLLVDEPSLGLSPLMVEEVFEFLGGLAASRVSIVLAEQNVRMALKVTDRAVVLSQGSIRSDMSAAALLGDAEFRRTYLGG
ncbi:MAG: ABC transporter ATP-binding protein [Rhodovulum sulfidophilum]|uniref:ABC transporter ATP-binding protein n=1 Tax=Rhodovulum sulfidophilum TaxID=35806 RepID=A0A2W5N3A8_RHOSU|nr:MAG: ABC transporter ATP-binding protein [Rhodovulum sulfidophilum]